MGRDETLREQESGAKATPIGGSRSEISTLGALAVRANSGVEAFVGDLEALHGLVAENVLLDDRFGIGQSHVAVPHGFGVNDDGGAVLALIKASCFVGANGRFDACFC